MTTFGPLLRDWRATRRFSQLDLSLAAGASARHISFLESGRAAPSRAMVLRLAETLEMPRPATNTALLAAGFAPLYPELSRDDERLAAVSKAIDLMLDNHLPLPAIAFDGVWNILQLNASAAALYAPLGISVGDNAIEALVDMAGESSPIINWLEVADLIAMRLRTEINYLGGETVLAGLLDQLVKRRQDIAGREPMTDGGSAALVPIRLRLGDRVIALFSMIAQFGSVQEIAMAGVRIELYFAEDDATQQFLSGLTFGD